MGARRFIQQYKRTIIAVILLFVLPLIPIYWRGHVLLREYERERPVEGATLLDVHGRVITILGKEGPAVYVPLDEIPATLRQAVIAVEDARFYRHFGLDPIGIIRAALVNLKARRTVQGASTITQQLAKNLFLTTERTLARKAEEAMLALMLERRFNKNQILERYLNEVYFGEGAYGIHAAAETYFGKQPSDLTLGESALLAGILRAPSALSPYVNRKRSLERRDLVLRQMESQGYISEAALNRALEEEIRLAPRPGGIAPYFIDHVTEELVRRYGPNLVFRGELQVETTLDLDMQRIAQQAWNPKLQGALVAIDPKSGHIRAMVGGRNYRESQFNRATKALRQPGSAFKPIIYAAALREGWRVNSIVEDIPRRIGDWEPENYNEAYWGPVTMKHALALSLNNAAVWTLSKIGLESATTMAQDLGITTLVPEDRHLGMALGGLTKGVTPLALAASFVPFANGGLYYGPRAIRRVSTKEGRILEQAPGKGRQVLTPQQAYLMTDMLKAAMEYGTGQPAAIDRPTAGKTGTTNNSISLWFVGYTPQLVTCVYVGNDDGTPVKGFGGTAAGPIWAEFMETALAELPSEDFPLPEGMVTGIEVDIFSGGLVVPGCEMTEVDVFIEGTEPTQPCPLHYQPPRRAPSRRVSPPQPKVEQPPQLPPVVPPVEPPAEEPPELPPEEPTPPEEPSEEQPEEPPPEPTQPEEPPQEPEPPEEPMNETPPTPPEEPQPMAPLMPTPPEMAPEEALEEPPPNEEAAP